MCESAVHTINCPLIPHRNSSYNASQLNDTHEEGVVSHSTPSGGGSCMVCHHSISHLSWQHMACTGA
jgi:hypothetical protein